MASTPTFVGTPKFTNVIINNSNAGDPAYVNPTTIATILTIGSGGGRIDNIYISPVGTNAATALRFFVDTVGSGTTNNKLLSDQSIPASTSVTTSAIVPVIWRPGLVLPANAVLRATVANTGVTNGVCVSVEYGEF
jgi:hypothetical protein